MRVSGRIAATVALVGVVVVCPAVSRAASDSAVGQPQALRGPVQQTAIAFPGKLEGLVSDEQGRPVGGAAISVQGGELTFAVSDREGRYRFEALRPGPYLVRAQHAGYVASRRAIVEVLPAGTSRHQFKLQRLSPAATAGEPPRVLAASMGAALQPEPAPDATAGEPDPEDAHGHSSIAWRLRHLKRSVLRDVDNSGAIIDEETVDADARWLFDALPFAGQVQLLTSGSFDTAGDLFGAGFPAGITHVAVGAPAGSRAQWAAQGALTQGDISSWVVGGSYSSLLGSRHALEMGATFSAQRYDGGNPAAILAMLDEARSVGALFAFDRWSVTPRATLSYGLHYARYGYLEDTGLASPLMSIRWATGGRSWLRASVSQQMRAPGAEEFVPSNTSGLWLPPQRTFSPVPGSDFEAQQVRNVELAFERQLGSFMVSTRGFTQAINDQIVTVFGMRIADQPRTDLGHYYTANAGDVRAIGWGVAVSRNVASRFRGAVEYTLTELDWAGAVDGAPMGPAVVPTRPVPAGERLHDVTASVETDFPETSTRVYALYKLNTGFARPEMGDTEPGFGARFDMQVSQRLPFMGFTSAEWEFLVAVRSLFLEQGSAGSVVDEVLVIRPPKRIVGGLLVRF